jgi:hypothetical protein
MRASEEQEQVQMLEIKKKRLEIEIDRLEQEIAADSADSFSRDQLATVRSELEHNSNDLFAQRTNGHVMKLDETRTERQSLERRVANLKQTLQTEQQLTKQLVDERAERELQGSAQPAGARRGDPRRRAATVRATPANCGERGPARQGHPGEQGHVCAM